MNRQNRNTALHLANPSTAAAALLDLDAIARRAFDGDRVAMDVLARELHARLVHAARIALGDLEHEADDVVQDLFVAILEGRVRAPRGPGEALAYLLRLTGVFARRHARQVSRFRSPG
jgi:DNA-directed RNA polymerase specialized sigma24 family protein